jgi:hypothetical protein
MAYRHGMRQADLDAYSRSGQRPRTQQGDRGDQVGVLWRAHENYVDPVNDFDSQSYPVSRTLPVIDPQSDFPEQVYLQEARQMRQWLARHYLDDWINDRDPRRGLEFADEEARMSQFARLFHAAACIQLDKLLNEEYPNTNLPFILRDFVGIDAARQAGAVQDDIVEPPIEGDFVWEIDDERLNNDFSFVGVAYRPHVELRAHDFFTDGPDERLPLDRQADAVTFAQIRMFIPRRRFYCCPWAVPTYTETGNPAGWYPNTDNWNFNWRDRNRQRYQKYAWSTFNQNWTIKLVPATAQSIPDILSAPPPPGSPVERAGLRTPQGLRRMSPESFRALNTH